MRTKKRPAFWIFLSAFAIPALALLLLSEPWSLLHFRQLSRDTLVHGAGNYLHTRTADQGQYVCLYVVNCDGNVAHLERIDDVRTLDIDGLKRTIWRRRFDADYCPGRTTNIGLNLVPQDGHTAENEAASHARWSFFNDRFIPQWGRYQSGAFTDQPWKTCTADASLNRQLTGLSGH